MGIAFLFLLWFTMVTSPMLLIREGAKALWHRSTVIVTERENG